VLVVGGGPAGSTIAALLARRGERVTLVEKDRHPRFHIGESLLPLNVPLFEELGIKDEIEQIGMLKLGVEFVSPHHGKALSLDFASGWDKRFFYSYQVRRSAFDHILLKNAIAKGATIVEGCRVTDVEFQPDGSVTASGRDEHGKIHSWHADFLVDASGRDTLLANRLSLKQRNRRHNSAAIFGHFTGARRSAGKAEGNITIYWFDHGWIWFIPLSDGTTSIGAVCPPSFLKSRTTDVTSFFVSVLAMCPALGERLKNAELTGAATATGNYSYQATRMTGKSYILLGDAFTFIDPVFSTGVYLAMRSAFLGADAVSACLHEPRKAVRALRRFDAEVRQGIERFSWYIYRITTPALRDLLMASGKNVARVEEALMSLLSGDVSRRSPIRFRLRVFQFFYYAKATHIFMSRLFARRGAGA
jgi:2-polyprenyl-6-methoxyphenol hydroxylase-like FAD-dependent oxidoreductase